MSSKRSCLSKLHIRISVSFLLILLLIIISLAGSIYIFAAGMINSHIKRSTKQTIEQTGEYIGAYIDKIRGLSNIIATHTDIKSALEKSDDKSLEAISSLIYFAKESDKWIRSIAVISKDGFAITSGNAMKVPLSDYMPSEEWYSRAVSSNQMPMLSGTEKNTFISDKDELTVSVYREIVGDNNEHLGIVFIDISYKFIEDYIQSLDLGKEGYVYIISDKGELIYYPDSSLFGKNDIDLVRKDTGNDSIQYEVDIPDSNWKLYGISDDSLKYLKSGLIKNIIISSLLSILLSIVLGITISKRLGKPIVELKTAMNKLDKNLNYIQINTSGISEIVELEKEYNNLIDRIKVLTKDIKDKEKDRRLFEIKALQSQINPHFLYNTLDTILWLAELGQQDEVVQVSSALGKLLRLSLNTEFDYVTLREELNHTKYYLEIQKVRYEDMLKYETGGDESILDKKVPKLILQPIVENAIYHGIRPKGGGKISILYAKEKGKLCIKVSDNGVGFENEDIDKIKDRQGLKLGGIGIKNVNQRIKLLCGKEYGIKIQSEKAEGSTVSITLPLESM